jgi:hypothetical protein
VAGVVDGAITIESTPEDAVSLFVRTSRLGPGGAGDVIELVVGRADAAVLGAALCAWADAASGGAELLAVPCRVGVRPRAREGRAR